MGIFPAGAQEVFVTEVLVYQERCKGERAKPAIVGLQSGNRVCYRIAMSEVSGGTLAAGIWDRVIGADDHALSPDEARALLRWKFADSDRQRVDKLSEKARAGKLSAAEQHELDEYLAIESALISLKSNARRALKSV